MTEENASRVRYLTKESVEAICHEMAARLFADEEPMGLYKDHDPAKLDSCINQPRQAVGGQDLYPSIFDKAAITFYLFNRNHVFGNGNKRLSVAALSVFLFINDWFLVASADELRDQALWLAQVEEPIGEVVAKLSVWIKMHCAKE
jgi:death on curing protein